MTKGNKRMHHESQKGYKKRLRTEQKIIKGWLRGRWIWKASGTYVRKLHGEIGSAAEKAR